MHPSLLSDVLVILIVLAVWAFGLYWPGPYGASIRVMLQSQPEAVAKFVGNGARVRLSRRFGRPHALGALALGMVWLFVTASVLPDSVLGFWISFGPASFLGLVCAVLSALVVCRWMVGDV
jgi:hypothetical protein